MLKAAVKDFVNRDQNRSKRRAEDPYFVPGLNHPLNGLYLRRLPVSKSKSNSENDPRSISA